MKINTATIMQKMGRKIRTAIRIIKIMFLSFRFFKTCIVICLCNKNQHNAHFLHKRFNLIIVSSTCLEHPSVHPQEDLYMQFYAISFMHLYKRFGDGRMCLISSTSCRHQTAYMDA